MLLYCKGFNKSQKDIKINNFALLFSQLSANHRPSILCLRGVLCMRIYDGFVTCQPKGEIEGFLSCGIVYYSVQDCSNF